MGKRHSAGYLENCTIQDGCSHGVIPSYSLRIGYIVLLVFLLLSTASITAARADRVYAWGVGYTGWYDVPQGADFKDISAGRFHNLALRTNGSLVAWGGLNWYGECNVPAGTGFKVISAGDGYSLALRTNGSLIAWGDTVDGKCNVPAGTGFKAISAGGGHSLALRTNGSLVAWGGNYYNQCNVPAGTGFKAISAGGGHSLALRTNGSLIAWGDNESGQCKVPPGTGYKAISAGAIHSLALRNDGSIVGWGDNEYGKCDVPPGTGYTAIIAGEYHSIALRSNGSLAYWGEIHSDPAVPPGTSYKAIGAGWGHSIALAPALTITKITPDNMVVGKNVTIRITGTGFTATNQVILTGKDTDCIIPASSVRIASHPAYSPTWTMSADFSIPFTAPGGDWELNVTNDRNESAYAHFRVDPLGGPTITGITPYSATRGALVTASVRGRNFTSPANVSLVHWGSGSARTGGTDPIDATVNRVGPTTIQCTFRIPWDQTRGSYGLFEENPDGQTATRLNCFFIEQVKQPVITRVSPPSTSSRGKTVTCTITGRDFTPTIPSPAMVTAALSQGPTTIPGTVTKASSSSSITAFFFIPESAPLGSYNLTVAYPSDPDNTNATLADAFRIRMIP